MFNLNSLTKLSFYIIVIAAPIQWISLLDIGAMSIKYINLSIIPILFCLLFADFRKSISKFFKANYILVIAFFLLMVFNFIYTCFTVINLDVGFSYILKNLSYLSYFIVFGPIVAYRYKSENFYKEIARSNFLCIIFFAIIVEVTFLSLGRNFISELISNFLKGNSVAIRYDLFYKLFNAHGNVGDDDYQTSLRNTLLGGFVYVNFTSLYSLKLCKKKFLKATNIFCICFTTFLILASTSRSNMVALALGYLLFFTFSVYSGKLHIKAMHVFSILVICFLCVIFFPTIQSVFSNSTSMIGDRLAKLEDDARWDLDEEALMAFVTNPLAGKGAGSFLSDGHRVHNFILGAAYQAGVIGFILSVIFYFGLIFKLIKSSITIKNKNELFWFASIVCVPLLRAMTSGNNGTLSIIEWFCLAFFLGVVMQEMEDRKEKAYEPVYG